MMTRHRLEAFGENPVEEALDGAVEKIFGRAGDRPVQVDGEGMTLPRANESLVFLPLEPVLVALGHRPQQILETLRAAGARQGGHDRLDRRPSRFIQLQPDGVRFVPEPI